MFLTLLTFISAIAISLIAAGYSILGLATLFAGAAVFIIAMGSALEVGKLVAAPHGCIITGAQTYLNH